MEIESSARKHGVDDEDMLHAYRNHWAAFATDDPDVTMFIGPSRTAEPIKVGIVMDESVRCHHPLHAGESQVLARSVMTLPSKSRAERADALEAWADTVDAADLVLADTSSLRTIAALANEASAIDRDLRDAVVRAREHGHSWSQIGSMLGVSKQAAQRKYSKT